MNDRTIGLLDQYELEVNLTWKGRGCILCDTAQGLKTMKKYEGPKEKIKLQNDLLVYIKENGTCKTEQIVTNKEGGLLTVDTDGSAYVVKDYFAGAECNIREPKECQKAVLELARLHQGMRLPELAKAYDLNGYSLEHEFEKHTKELQKARKYIHLKRQKSDFERFLMNHYDSFFESAREVTEQVREHNADGEKRADTFCHGDFQHHNLLQTGERTAVINFEKCVPDSQMRDVCLFLRKLLEKNNWSQPEGFGLLEAYHSVKALTVEDWRQIYFRLAYPEKFWKIVNFYFNSGKAWIPEKNMEKLQKLQQQEENRKQFLKQVALRASLAL